MEPDEVMGVYRINGEICLFEEPPEGWVDPSKAMDMNLKELFPIDRNINLKIKGSWRKNKKQFRKWFGDTRKQKRSAQRLPQLIKERRLSFVVPTQEQIEEMKNECNI